MVGKVGTATVSKKELDAALQLIPQDIVSKQINLEELENISKDLRTKGKRIVKKIVDHPRCLIPDESDET